MSVGYYTVGGTKFYSKTAALIEATKTNVFPQWHFGDNEFANLDFTAIAQLALPELYRLRAEQLREKYDYLILSFSGGSDSWTVLNSFISNGIHLDEVLVKWPVNATSNLYVPNSRDTSTENILSEWDICIKPVLQQLTTYYPNTKITVYDYSDDFDSDLIEDDWFCINDHFTPGVFRRYGLELTENQQKLQDAGKTVAMIWGIDKPQLAFRDDCVWMYFLDKLANTSGVTGSANRINELFFWTPDMPELAVQQALHVYEYFVLNPLQSSLIKFPGQTRQDKKVYDQIAKTIIYPHWNINTFQVDKPTQVVNNQYDWWMFKLLQDYRYFQSWQYGLDSIKNAVHPKYYHLNSSGQFDGWIGFISPFYKLGPLYV